MAFAVPSSSIMKNNSNNSNRHHTSTSSEQWANASFASQTTVADEAAVDAYCVKVLEDASPPDVAVDAEYLGSYLTGVLRAEQVSWSHLQDLPDYDNVLELLQEHCSMTRADATITLQKIARAVDTGIVPRYSVVVVPSPSLGPFGSPPSSLNSIPALSALQLLESVNVEEAVEESHNNNNNSEYSRRHQLDSTVTAETNNNNSNNNSDSNLASTANSLISPVQPDNLIPFDLLGAMDDEDGPAATVDPLQDEFPSLAVAASARISKKALRSSRSRQGSLDESSILSSEHSSKKVSPNLQPAQPSAAIPPQQQPYFYTLDGHVAETDHEEDPATMLQMACDYLQQMNPDMGSDAIFHAATMAESNVGVAQYLMECAMSAPPVCRHLLNAGCYRSDCQFSHDLDGHTCVFWVRGRCTKGSACPFLHGYNDKWLIQLVEEQHQQHQLELEQAELEQQQAYQLQQEHDFSFYHDGWDHASLQHQPQQETTGSFANIASQGYNNQTCFQPVRSLDDNNLYMEETKFAIGSVPTMQIPQNVWNPHERRDASAFHIADPMERYREVSRLHLEAASSRYNSSSTVYNRTDVIDLHFQSTKTYAVVLEQVLPEKLAAEPQGVWIVTGTGHHVGSKTHQKGGGILETAVMGWLTEHGYDFWKGKDRNGYGGALFVKNSSLS